MKKLFTFNNSNRPTTFQFHRRIVIRYNNKKQEKIVNKQYVNINMNRMTYKEVYKIILKFGNAGKYKELNYILGFEDG